MTMHFKSGLTALFIISTAGAAHAAIISGDPASDPGWSLAGHSLQSGIYVDGSVNYGFDAYTAAFTVQPGSDLEIADAMDPSLSWLVGDTVLGVGGHFRDITAAEAGWGAISGEGVNARLPDTSGPKLQAKFGTSAATWSPSAIAPAGGNGNGSSSNGGGRVQIRTSGYFQTGAPHPGQTEPWTLDGNSGQLLVLDKDDHIDWAGASAQPSKYTARMAWHWDAGLGHVTGWELLLNVSLLSRQAPGDFTGLIPAVGDAVIMTVQDGDGPYTNAQIGRAHV